MRNLITNSKLFANDPFAIFDLLEYISSMIGTGMTIDFEFIIDKINNILLNEKLDRFIKIEVCLNFANGILIENEDDYEFSGLNSEILNFTYLLLNKAKSLGANIDPDEMFEVTERGANKYEFYKMNERQAALDDLQSNSNDEEYIDDYTYNNDDSSYDNFNIDDVESDYYLNTPFDDD